MTKAERIAAILDEKKAEDIRILEIGHLTSICDYFVICTGTSDTHTRALAQAVFESFGEKRIRGTKLEGFDQGAWILMDFADVVVHIFLPETREFYDIEEFWRDAHVIAFEQILNTSEP